MFRKTNEEKNSVDNEDVYTDEKAINLTPELLSELKTKQNDLIRHTDEFNSTQAEYQRELDELQAQIEKLKAKEKSLIDLRNKESCEISTKREEWEKFVIISINTCEKQTKRQRLRRQHENNPNVIIKKSENIEVESRIPLPTGLDSKTQETLDLLIEFLISLNKKFDIHSKVEFNFLENDLKLWFITSPHNLDVERREKMAREYIEKIIGRKSPYDRLRCVYLNPCIELKTEDLQTIIQSLKADLPKQEFRSIINSMNHQ